MMLRIAFSFIGSLVFFYMQSLIVMRVFHLQNIYFAHLTQVLAVLCIDFFLAFSILTQIMPWFMKLNKLDMDE